ncbi:MAG: polyprenyl diphosphate synthase, partial [Pseudomonadota bacterium]
SIPRHVCIIMDGNGRWAKKRLMPRNMGHRKGVEATRRAIGFFAQAGVKNLTLFAFSSENWNRPEEEVSSLMDLFVQSLKQNTEELNQRGIRICFIGNRDAFSEQLRSQIHESETLTAKNQVMRLNVAANYGGQWDIVETTRTLARQVQQGQLEPDQIDESRFAATLSLGDVEPPDLFIRTGGEQRISNFLLWQCAYAELYFCDVLWPDFSESDMRKALDVYGKRQRRYGKTGDQIEEPV